MVEFTEAQRDELLNAVNRKIDEIGKEIKNRIKSNVGLLESTNLEGDIKAIKAMLAVEERLLADVNGALKDREYQNMDNKTLYGILENSFICPITQQILDNPVIVVESAQVYGADAIATWFSDHETDPSTNLILRGKSVFRSITIAQLTDELKKVQDALYDKREIPEGVDIKKAVDDFRSSVMVKKVFADILKVWNEGNYKEIDKLLKCPITQEFFKDPVIVAETGNIYERAAIGKWLENNDIDPSDEKKQKLSSKELLAAPQQLKDFVLVWQKFYNNPKVKIFINLKTALDEQDYNKVESLLKCPITTEFFKDPVIVAETGNIYERAAIEKWLREKGTDPSSDEKQQELSSKDLIPFQELNDFVDKVRGVLMPTEEEEKKEEEEKDPREEDRKKRLTERLRNLILDMKVLYGADRQRSSQKTKEIDKCVKSLTSLKDEVPSKPQYSYSSMHFTRELGNLEEIVGLIAKRGIMTLDDISNIKREIKQLEKFKNEPYKPLIKPPSKLKRYIERTANVVKRKFFSLIPRS